MSNDIEYPNNPNRGKVFAGIILLVVGGLLLLHQFTFFIFPYWLFRWPMWLILWGLYSGFKHDFRKPLSVILIIIGLAFLLDDILPGINLSGLVWPILIIGFGLWIILRRNHKWDRNNWKNWDKHEWNNWKGKNTYYQSSAPADPIVDYKVADPADPNTTEPVQNNPSAEVPPNRSYYPGDDYLDAVSIFGGVNKTMLSKNFKGGDIVNVFGGAELDFTQADINGRVVIEITQIFGGAKIIVPSNWQVVSDISAIFASVDDKRIRNSASATGDKILVLKGVSLFAGIDIRSY